MLFVFIFLDDYFFILVLVHLLHCLKIVCLHLVCTMIVSSLLTSPQWDQLLSKEQLLLCVCISIFFPGNLLLFLLPLLGFHYRFCLKTLWLLKTKLLSTYLALSKTLIVILFFIFSLFLSLDNQLFLPQGLHYKYYHKTNPWVPLVFTKNLPSVNHTPSNDTNNSLCAVILFTDNQPFLLLEYHCKYYHKTRARSWFTKNLLSTSLPTSNYLNVFLVFNSFLSLLDNQLLLLLGLHYKYYHKTSHWVLLVFTKNLQLINHTPSNGFITYSFWHVHSLYRQSSAASSRVPLQVLPQDKSSFIVYEEPSINQPSYQ